MSNFCFWCKYCLQTACEPFVLKGSSKSYNFTPTKKAVSPHGQTAFSFLTGENLPVQVGRKELHFRAAWVNGGTRGTRVVKPPCVKESTYDMEVLLSVVVILCYTCFILFIFYT